jgi:hypothetical protein
VGVNNFKRKEEGKEAMTTASESHQHDFKYYGAIVLTEDGNAIGAVDVWRCSICHSKGIELRMQSLSNLSAEVGFPILDDDKSRWVAIICNETESPKFDLKVVKLGDEIVHECVGANGKVSFRIGNDFKLDGAKGRHSMELLDDHMNDNLELRQVQ